MPTLKYRTDGWPLCPRCGEDELWSQVPITVSLVAKPTDRLSCYRCQWEGLVPPRAAAGAQPDAQAGVL